MKPDNFKDASLDKVSKKPGVLTELWDPMRCFPLQEELSRFLFQISLSKPDGEMLSERG